MRGRQGGDGQHDEDDTIVLGSTLDPSSAPPTEADLEETLPAVDPSGDPLVAGRYRVIRVIGAGGMGTVFEAVHVELDKRVAIKALASFLHRQAEPVARFLREARASCRIESDHVAQVFDVGEDPNLGLYMVMELLQGEDLAHAIGARGALRAEDAAGVAWQVCLALERAHVAGVVHRDLKSANVFLVRADDGSIKVKVLDFGVAKLLKDASELVHGSITRAGVTLGTPQYMSPEQAQGLPWIDRRADLYSLGVVLYEAITGAPPYPDDEPYERTLYRILNEPTPRLSERAPDVPPAIDQLVADLMARDPAQRPPTASDVRSRLVSIYPRVGRRPLVFGAAPSLAGVPAPVAPPPRTASGLVMERRRSTMPPAARRATSMVLAALGTMVVGSFVLALFASRARAPESDVTQATAAPSAIAPTAPPATSAMEPAPPATGLAALERDAQPPFERADAAAP